MARGPLAGPSGPGKFSTREDLPSSYYGEGVETSAIKSQIPLSKTTGSADDVGGRPRNPLTPVTPLFAETTRPSEPITNGIAMGEGAGPEALMMQSQFANRRLSDILAEMIPYDTTGEVQYLYQNALSRGQ